jgi:hypothetical protein
VENRFQSLPFKCNLQRYIMFPCTLVVGPAIEFRDYLDWLNKKGAWGGKGGALHVGIKLTHNP